MFLYQMSKQYVGYNFSTVQESVVYFGALKFRTWWGAPSRRRHCYGTSVERELVVDSVED